MKFIKILSIIIFFLFISFTSYINFFGKENNKKLSIMSPLPFIKKEILAAKDQQNYWKPNIENVYDVGSKKLELTAISAISYDLTTDKLLYSKNIKERYPIASLTKIATAITALENEDINKIIKINKEAANIGEDSMGLSLGEELRLEELLYGLILHSGNDSAEAIAYGSKIGRENFVYLMNKEVEDLGLTDTHFTNPSGLEGDGNQYSTSYDLLVLTKYALKNRKFLEIVSTVNYDIPQTEKHKGYSLFNETNLLTSYPGVKGVKTGFTDEAGYCLVTYLEYDGHKIIAVILNSQSRREEMKELLDYSLKTLGVTPPPHS